MQDKNFEKYKKLLEFGPYISGYNENLVSLYEVKWLNKNLLKKGLKFYNEYMAAYYTGTSIGILIALVSVKPLSAIFLRTKKPLAPDAYFTKWLGKFKGVYRFYQELLKNEETAHNAFSKIRKMHMLSANRKPKIGDGVPLPELWNIKPSQTTDALGHAVKRDLESVSATYIDDNRHNQMKLTNYLSWNVNVPISQMDMVAVTTVFFGVVWLNPSFFGLINATDDELKGLIHVWALFVRLLGVHDEFNIYIEADSHVIDKMLADIWLESMKNLDATTIHLQQWGIEGLRMHSKLLSFVTHKAFLYLTVNSLMKINGDNQNKFAVNIWKLLQWKDKLAVRLLQGAMIIMGATSFTRKVSNKCMTLYIKSYLQNK